MPKGKKRSRSREDETKNVRMKPLTLKIEREGTVFNDSSINLKDVCCRIIDQTLFPTRHFGGRLEVIHNYLAKVQDKNSLIGKNMIPSQEEIHQDLNKAFNELKKSRGRLVGTPALSDEELTTLYLTPEQAKHDQIKKDDWLNRLVENSEGKSVEEKNRNMEEWLLEMKIDDRPPPLTPPPRGEKRTHGDEWVDLSIIYANAIEVLKTKEKKGGVTELMKALPDDIPKTYIEINVGKLEDCKEKLRQALEGIGDKLKDFTDILKTFILGSIKIGILIFGTFVRISAEFVANLLINFIKSKTNNIFRELFSRVVEGTIQVPFVISSDNSDIQREIIDKYKLFLTGIVIKTLFMLGNIGYDWSSLNKTLPANIREIFKIGINRLDLYNQDKLTKKPSDDMETDEDDYRLHNQGDRERADRIMNYMNKYTEWYLKRKTTIFLNTNNGEVDDLENPRVLLLEDRKPVSQMTSDQIMSAQGFGPFGSQPLVPGPGNELDSDGDVQMPDTSGQSKKKKKNTKKRKRKSNTKNRKRKPKTKKRKKIKKKTKQKK